MLGTYRLIPVQQIGIMPLPPKGNPLFDVRFLSHKC